MAQLISFATFIGYGVEAENGYKLLQNFRTSSKLLEKLSQAKIVLPHLVSTSEVNQYKSGQGRESVLHLPSQPMALRELKVTTNVSGFMEETGCQKSSIKQLKCFVVRFQCGGSFAPYLK